MEESQTSMKKKRKGEVDTERVLVGLQDLKALLPPYKFACPPDIAKWLKKPGMITHIREMCGI